MIKQQPPEDLKRFRVWGMSLLQLMSLLFVTGIVLHLVLNWIF
jgi:hypothetical protein